MESAPEDLAADDLENVKRRREAGTRKRLS
jgi:hypothetical protein